MEGTIAQLESQKQELVKKMEPIAQNLEVLSVLKEYGFITPEEDVDNAVIARIATRVNDLMDRYGVFGKDIITVVACLEYKAEEVYKLGGDQNAVIALIDKDLVEPLIGIDTVKSDGDFTATVINTFKTSLLDNDHPKRLATALLDAVLKREQEFLENHPEVRGTIDTATGAVTVESNGGEVLH